jgi:DNA-binding winged helix-turn-helix (wHTH) protein
MPAEQHHKTSEPGTSAPRYDKGIVAPMKIGDWDADPAMNTLRRGEQLVHVEPKAMELLVFLGRRSDQVVSRDELLAGVWPGVVVGDDALTQAIIKLRKALGDSPREPTYIQTVPKRGYRLIAPSFCMIPSSP